MQHCDPADLALVALDESSLDAELRDHLQQCPQCQAEVEQFQRVVSIGRSIQVADQPVAPPPSVWDSITSEIAAQKSGSHAHPDVSDSLAAMPVAPDLEAEVEPQVTSQVGPDTSTGGSGGATVVDLASERRRRRWVPMAIAAAACLAVGGIAGSVITRAVDPGPVVQPAVVATAPLKPVDGGPDPLTTGVAKVENIDGQYVLQVDARGLRTPDGFYEVWLMDEANAGLIAIGTFNANQDKATFPIPNGVSLTEFNSVDISDEPFDGVPGHSAVSVLRGSFTI